MEPIVAHGGPARRGQATGMVAAVGRRVVIAPKGRSVVRDSPASHAYFTSPHGSRPVEAEAGFSHLATVRPAPTRTSHARSEEPRVGRSDVCSSDLDSPASHAYFPSPHGSRPVEAEAGFSHLAPVRPAATRTSHARVHISSLLICLLPGLQLVRLAALGATDHRRKGWMGDPLDVHFLQSRLYRKESLATRAGARKVPKELRNPLVQRS